MLDERMNYPRLIFYLLKSLTEEVSFPDPSFSVRGEACPIYPLCYCWDTVLERSSEATWSSSSYFCGIAPKKNWKITCGLQCVPCVWSDVIQWHFLSLTCPVNSVLVFRIHLPHTSTKPVFSIQQWFWMFSAKKGNSNISNKKSV